MSSLIVSILTFIIAILLLYWWYSYCDQTLLPQSVIYSSIVPFILWLLVGIGWIFCGMFYWLLYEFYGMFFYYSRLFLICPMSWGLSGLITTKNVKNSRRNLFPHIYQCCGSGNLSISWLDWYTSYGACLLWCRSIRPVVYTGVGWNHLSKDLRVYPRAHQWLLNLSF